MISRKVTVVSERITASVLKAHVDNKFLLRFGQRAGNWLLHDGNAPSHRALATREFLAHNSIITCPHPPYSPDLAPCDFFLFPKMKLKLKGRRFDGLEIQRESQNVLGTLREQDFRHAFQQWQRRWDRCVAAQGDYFEGDIAQT